jgi:hypothetical protein
MTHHQPHLAAAADGQHAAGWCRCTCPEGCAGAGAGHDHGADIPYVIETPHQDEP